MGMKLTRRYVVEAAHQLTAGVPEGHPCRRLHGHRYLVEVDVMLVGKLVNGMVLEYIEIDEKVRGVLELVDHHFLNTLADRARVAMEYARMVSENSTVEHFALWVIHALHAVFESRVKVVAVRIEEDPDSAVEVTA